MTRDTLECSALKRTSSVLQATVTFYGFAVLLRGKESCVDELRKKDDLFCLQVEGCWLSVISNRPWTKVSEHVVETAE